MPKTRLKTSQIETLALTDPDMAKGHYIVHEGYYQSLSRYRKYLNVLKEVFAFKTDLIQTTQVFLKNNFKYYF